MLITLPLWMIWSTSRVVEEQSDHCVILGRTVVAQRKPWLDPVTRAWRFVLGADWLAYMLFVLETQSGFPPSCNLRFQVGFRFQEEINWAKFCNFRFPLSDCPDIGRK